MNKKDKSTDMHAININGSSSSYDEMKFIDDWIHGMYLEQKADLKERIYDDESSFSSVMNFYMQEGDNECTDHEDSTQNISFVLNDVSEHVDEDDPVDLNETSQCSDRQPIFPEALFDTTIQDHTKEEIRHVVCHNQDVEQDQQIKYQSGSSSSTNLTERKDAQNGLNITKTILESKIVLDVMNKRRRKQLIVHDTEPIHSELPNSSTYALLKIAEKRVAESNRTCEIDIPRRRFVIETREMFVNLNKADKLTDLRSKTIMGKLYKRNSKGYYNYNWFTLKENFFTCYNSKGIKTNGFNIPVERNGDFADPENNSIYYTKKYTIDLLKSRLYLCKKRGKSDLFTCYSESVPAESDLVDITDLTVLNIVETAFGYRVVLKKEVHEFNVMLTCLNFCFKTDDSYRFYKVTCVDDFLKWIIAFKFRLGQITMSIG